MAVISISVKVSRSMFIEHNSLYFNFLRIHSKVWSFGDKTVLSDSTAFLYVSYMVYASLISVHQSGFIYCL